MLEPSTKESWVCSELSCCLTDQASVSLWQRERDTELMIFLLVSVLAISLDFTDVGSALPDDEIVTDNRGFPSFQLQDHVKPDP